MKLRTIPFVVLALLALPAALAAQVDLGGPEYGFQLSLDERWEWYEEEAYAPHPTCGYLLVAHPGDPAQFGTLFRKCWSGPKQPQEVVKAFQASEEIQSLCANPGDCVFSKEPAAKAKLAGGKVWTWTWTYFDGEHRYTETEYFWLQGDYWVQLSVECLVGDAGCWPREVVEGIEWLK